MTPGVALPATALATQPAPTALAALEVGSSVPAWAMLLVMMALFAFVVGVVILAILAIRKAR
jgi:uncharacterized membrane protein YoaK (UPF0700 family)